MKNYCYEKLLVIPIVLLLLGTGFNLQAQCGCDTIISLTETEFNAESINGGDTICLQGGVRNTSLEIKNINPYADDTVIIVITNYDGVVVFPGGTPKDYCIKISSSKYFKLTGTGEPYIDYGIECKNEKYGINIVNDSCSQFDVDHISFEDLSESDASGIRFFSGLRDSAHNRSNYSLDSILIHHNLFKNINYAAIVLNSKTAQGDTLFPAVFNHVLIYNNTIDSTQLYGIYAKSACNMKIYNNKITNYSLYGGTANSAIHVAEYSMASCFNNFIKDGLSHGIAFWDSKSYGNDTLNRVFNNVIIKPENNTSDAIHQKYTEIGGNVNLNVFNNTIIAPELTPIKINSSDTLNSFIVYNNLAISHNNLISKPNWQLIDSSKNWIAESKNVFNFVDPLNHDYRLLPTSTAIDSGLNLYNQGITSDFDGHARPTSGNFDVGAFEMLNPWPVSTDTMQFSIIITDSTNLLFDEASLKTGDYIGVFYDSSGTEKCAGNLFWKGQTDTLIAYGDSTGIGGFEIGDSIVWKVWRHDGASETQNGNTIKDLVPTYDLILNDSNTFADGAVSRLTGLYQYQDIVLRNGWNMISTYIKAIDNSCDRVFSEILENILIVKDENENFFSPDSSNNTLDSIVVTEGYKVKTSAACTLRIVGIACLPESNEVVADSGWSLIGYTRRTTDSIVYMMKPFIDEVEIVKNQDGYVYWPGYEVNQILVQQAGHGYEFNANDDLSFYYPALYLTYDLSDSYQPKSTPQPKRYLFNEKTDNSMGLGLPLAAWDKMPEPGDEIGVFDTKGNLVGSTVFRKANLGITVWGNDFTIKRKKGLVQNENFTIKLYNAKAGKEETLIVEQWESGDNRYSNNKISIAKKISRVKEDGQSYNRLELYAPFPNPTNEKVTIPFFLPDESNVMIRLLNMQGKEIVYLNAGLLKRGTHKQSLNIAGISAGTYIYKVETSEETRSGMLNIFSL